MPCSRLFNGLRNKSFREHEPSKASQRILISDGGKKLDLQSSTLDPHEDNRIVGCASPVPRLSNITSVEDKYAFLSTFDTIFVIDDSGSMAGRSWREVREAVGAIAPICAHDPDGIDVYFFNHKSGSSASGTQAPSGYYQIKDVTEVQRLFESIQPDGATPTGPCLLSILNPYYTNLAHNTKNTDSTKPINIIFITDGCPTDDPESIIIQYARKLDQLEAPPHLVGIQFFQVGEENGAGKALRELDDNLADLGIRNIVDTATWSPTSWDNNKTLTADGILKVVLDAVVRRLDRANTNVG